MNITENHIQILKHSIGIDNLRWYEVDRINAEPYRNYFATGSDGENYQRSIELVSNGFMVGPYKKFEMDYFMVTDKGVQVARKSAMEYAKKTKPSRSKARYQAYLHSESEESFFDWLKNNYWNDFRKRYGV